MSDETLSQAMHAATPLLKLPSLKPFLVGRTLSALASQVLAVAVGWQIYALTHSIRALGFIGLAQFLPMLGLVFIAGHVADQHDRRRIVIICQTIQIIGLAVMAAGTYTGWLTSNAIYILVALFGALRAFEMPCQQTFVASIVSPADMPRATALSASLFQTASIVGPSIGGLLYGVGPAVCYALCTAAMIVALGGTIAMHPSRPAPSRTPVSLASVFGGIAFLRRRRDTLGAISLDLFAVLLGGATAMLPVYANDILHTGPIGLGMLRAAPAIGALLMSVAIARIPLGDQCGRIMFASVVIFGIATIIFGISHNVTLSVISLAVLGAADVISVMIRSALVQLGTPDEMRGRVSAVNMLFIGSSNQLGEFESGMLGSLVGPESAVVIGGLGTIIVAGLWIRMFPSLWKLGRIDKITPN